MIRRFTWFLSGILTGIGAFVFVGGRVRRRLAEFAPGRMAERTVDRTRRSISRMRTALDEGRVAMSQRETELRRRFRVEVGDVPTSNFDDASARQRR